MAYPKNSYSQLYLYNTAKTQENKKVVTYRGRGHVDKECGGQGCEGEGEESSLFAFLNIILRLKLKK